MPSTIVLAWDGHTKGEVSIGRLPDISRQAMTSQARQDGRLLTHKVSKGGPNTEAEGEGKQESSNHDHVPLPLNAIANA